jgi:hypothetical protein
MNSSPDPLKSSNRFPGDPPELFPVSDNPAELPPDRTSATPLLRKIFIACLAIGLVIGLGVSIVVINLIDRWGLADKPIPQLEQKESPALPVLR